MKYLNSRLTLLLVLFFTTVLPLAAITVDEVPNVHVADRTQYVSNPSGILSSAAVSNLNAQIGALWANTAPSKPEIFSTTLGTMATASAVPSDPSIKSFCISTTTKTFTVNPPAFPYLYYL